MRFRFLLEKVESQVVEDVGVIDDVSELEVDLLEVLIEKVLVQQLTKEKENF